MQFSMYYSVPCSLGGFLKLDSNELMPVTVSLDAPSPSSAFRGGAIDPPAVENSSTTNQVNHTSEAAASSNLFLQFLARTR